MFTGIIEEIGEILNVRHGKISSCLTIRGNLIFTDLKIGDSVSVNGVCLTVTTMENNTFTADVMAETLRRSNLGSFKVGTKVNLERAMAVAGRLGGHIVSGHIDGTGNIISIKKEDNAFRVKISTSKNIMKYIIEKGSIAIDGISLTVAEIEADSFSVSIIPHTGSETTLLSKKAGDMVNLENDVIGKYVEHLLKFVDISQEAEENIKNSGITSEFLMENGFI